MYYFSSFSMLQKKSLIVFLIPLYLFSCGQASNEHYEQTSSYQTESNDDYAEEAKEIAEIPVTESPKPRTADNDFISSSAAKVNADTSKKFIRTADIKFRVKNVYDATIGIENITSQFEGYVSYTKLNSNVNYTTLTPISTDSSLETVWYTVANTIIIRVPNTELDTTIRSISKYIDFLDHRTIEAKNVTISMLANKMAQKRQQEHSKRLGKAIDNKGSELEDITNAEQSRLNSQERKDYAKISDLELQDKIEMSTINLNIYQRKTVKRTLLKNYENTEAYEPGFFKQLGEAVCSGWEVLKDIVIGLFSIWPIIAIIVTFLLLYLRFLRKRK